MWPFIIGGWDKVECLQNGPYNDKKWDSHEKMIFFGFQAGLGVDTTDSSENINNRYEISYLDTGEADEVSSKSDTETILERKLFLNI